MANLAVKSAVAGQSDVLQRVKAFWDGRTPKQRVYLGVALGVALAALALAAQWLTDPNYKPLMTGLDPADLQTITSELAQKKVSYRTGADGTSVSVPADQLDAARLEVASHDAPHSGRIGFEIFDKVSWGETEFDEKVNYQRALEGELERTIQTMSNVKTARVHLVMATDSVFSDHERGAKASVVLELRGGQLSREQSAAIARLVAGAVDELKPADVAIVDADSNLPMTGDAADGGAGDDPLQRSLSKRLVETLSPVVGADRLHATVNVEYDTSTSEQSQEKYDPAVSVPLNLQTSEETSNGGASVGGVPGTTSNVPGAKASPPPPQPGQSSKSQTATYGVNRTTLHVMEPAGRIRRITAAVVVDDALERHVEKGKWVESTRKRTADELKLIAELAQASVGYDNSRGDVVNVENLAFERGAPADVHPVTWVDKTSRIADSHADLLRYAGLAGAFALIYLLMIRPIQKSALAAVPMPLELGAAEQPAQLPDGLGSPELLAQRAMQLKRQLAESVRANPTATTTAIRTWLQEDKA